MPIGPVVCAWTTSTSPGSTSSQGAAIRKWRNGTGTVLIGPGWWWWTSCPARRSRSTDSPAETETPSMRPGSQSLKCAILTACRAPRRSARGPRRAGPGVGEVGRVQGRQDLDPGIDVLPQHQAVLGQCASRAVHRDGMHRHPVTHGEFERTVLEGLQPPVVGAAALREEQHRRALVEQLPAARHHPAYRLAAAAHQPHVPVEPHVPAHHRHPEDLRLGHPFERPEQVEQHQDVDQRGVVRHDHRGAAPGQPPAAGGTQPPERVDRT